MSGVVAWLRQEFRGAFGIICLAPNSAHQDLAEFSAHKGILVHVTGETSPKRSRKWPKKEKRSRKIRNVAKKMYTKFNFTINFSAISCAPSSAQSCGSSAQQCAEFSASAWEGVRRSGWKFSILAASQPESAGPAVERMWVFTAAPQNDPCQPYFGSNSTSNLQHYSEDPEKEHRYHFYYLPKAWVIFATCGDLMPLPQCWIALIVLIGTALIAHRYR